MSRKPMADADRGIEDYGLLQGLIGKPGVYRRLMERFQDADKRYNSGLFDFRKDTVRKTGTVPDCGRVRAAGDCPEFSRPSRPTNSQSSASKSSDKSTSNSSARLSSSPTAIGPRSKRNRKSAQPANRGPRV